MNHSDLLKRLSERIHENDIREIISLLSLQKDENGIHALYTWVYHTDLRVSANAAWILTHLDACHTPWLYSRQKELIEEAMQTTNTGKRRLILTILLEQPFDKEEINGTFLEFCLKHMISVQESIGVKSLCMKLAYKQCVHFPELLEELRMHLEVMEPDLLSPGLKVARKKILNHISRSTRHS